MQAQLLDSLNKLKISANSVIEECSNDTLTGIENSIAAVSQMMLNLSLIKDKLVDISAIKKAYAERVLLEERCAVPDYKHVAETQVITWLRERIMDLSNYPAYLNIGEIKAFDVDKTDMYEGGRASMRALKQFVERGEPEQTIFRIVKAKHYEAI